MAFNENELQSFIKKYYNKPKAFCKLFKNKSNRKEYKEKSSFPNIVGVIQNISKVLDINQRKITESSSEKTKPNVRGWISDLNDSDLELRVNNVRWISDLNDSDLDLRVNEVINAQSFSDYLLYLSNLKNIDSVEIYKNANIDRKTFSKIKSDVNYHPKKLTALQLCIGLKLNIDESIDLLRHAGYTFSNASKTDVIFAYFIENKNFDIYAIDEALLKFEEPTISKY